MDLHCPATVVCLSPGDELPDEVGGQRVVAAYTFGPLAVPQGVPVRVEAAPAGKFWDVVAAIADGHRGEGVILFAPDSDLQVRDLRGVSLSVDSAGPTRI